jgi:hypothetical protein
MLAVQRRHQYRDDITSDNRVINERDAVDGVGIVRVNQSTRRKPVPVPLRPPQTPRDLTLGRTRAAQWEVSN